MKESDLYQSLIEGANHEGWLLFRIADGSFGKKVADIAGSDANGRAVILEIKAVEASFPLYTPFPWDLFSLHQRNWLRAYNAVGAVALTGIYEKSTRRMRIYPITSPTMLDVNILLGDLGRIELHLKQTMYVGWSEISRTIVGVNALRARGMVR